MRADDRHEDQEDDEDPARHRHPVPAQPPPGDLSQRAASTDACALVTSASGDVPR
jgi:hypothetical protein